MPSIFIFYLRKKNAELKSSAKSKSENGKTLTASEPCVPQGAFALLTLCKIILISQSSFSSNLRKYSQKM